ncbi:MAG: glycosyltransferase family 2 protein [Bdellovibrionota bacterium]
METATKVLEGRVTVILPAHNEAAAIGDVIQRVQATVKDCPILVVDDGSTDETARIAQEAGARVVRHPYRKGNGAAVKTGLRSASTEYVVLLDGDGQHPPEKIPDLLVLAPTHELVVAARTGKAGSPLHRRLANFLYNLLASYVTGRKILDLTSGFRLFHRPTILRYLYLFPNTFSYPATSTLALLRSGHSVAFVPVRFSPRTGKSKISLLADGTRFLLIIFRITMMFSPLRIFFPLSLLLFFAGSAYAGVRLYRFHTFPPAALLTLVTSVLVFALGLISEQIAQLRLAFTEEKEEVPRS